MADVVGLAAMGAATDDAAVGAMEGCAATGAIEAVVPGAPVRESGWTR